MCGGAAAVLEGGRKHCWHPVQLQVAGGSMASYCCDRLQLAHALNRSQTHPIISRVRFALVSALAAGAPAARRFRLVAACGGFQLPSLQIL